MAARSRPNGNRAKGFAHDSRRATRVEGMPKVGTLLDLG
jgi:hypothetical protein